VEIDISIWNGEDSEDWNNEDQKHFTKQVVLHQRPVDLNEMIRKRDEANADEAGGGLGANQQGVDGDSTGKGDDPNDPNADDFFGGDAATQGSVAECVRANWSVCVDRYGEGNCGVWSNVTSVPIGAFGIDLPWCNP
jgi:hypothetical protein